MQKAKDLIDHYKLEAHPEGGYYRETYRSTEAIVHTALPGRFIGERSFSTAIYFLLEKGSFSAFHRIKSDECWHFYSGGCLLVHIIYKNVVLRISDWFMWGWNIYDKASSSSRTR